ncbi:MAG: serine/threonine protein kinase [Deltaproteobacteria bacterium]|nr:serine/threonine protein kinase [Deltaproteobacteria bacterium]
MSSNESKIPVGTLLVGKYRVLREIGRGGMAAVYEAEQLSLGKKVAVKVLASELAASTIVIERFFREARAAASVKSPYIVDVYDSGRLDDGRPFIAMEMLEGESLYDRMARVRIIDIDTTIRCIVHTARGLVKAHASGIVHRDLKPENIFLTKGEDGDDICKILDFGLAKFYAPVNPEEKAQKRLTREGAVFGTPAYMSPEQVKGQGNVDHRADLWALGCMAYECLIGRPVWNMDQGVAMTFAAIATGPIPVPSDARADLPPAFDAWFKKCLERDPNNRYQSARELSDAFVEAWGQRSSSAASFPSMAMPGSGRHRAANAFGSGGTTSETSAVSGLSDVLEPSIPRATPSRRNGAAPDSQSGFNGGRMGSVGSDASMPMPLVQRTSQEVPPSAERDTPLPRTRRTSPIRIALSATFVAASVSAALLAWVRFLNPQVFTPLVRSSATIPASANASSNAGSSGGPATDEPKWAPTIAEAQRLFTEGKAQEALKKLQDATAMGPQPAVVAKVYTDQIKVAIAPPLPKEQVGPCRAVAFARPRMLTDKKAERPAVRALPKGMLVTWTDDHEQKDHDHVYGVLLDFKGAPIGPVRDLTPEATDAQRPQLTAPSADSDKSVLLYWDAKGRDAGIRVRFLDGDGRIDQANGKSYLVGAARPGDYWPAIERGPKGFFVVWQDDRDKEKEYDLFIRALGNDLETVGPETRLTDYTPGARKGPVPKVRYPSVAVAANKVFITYKLEKDKDKLVMRMKLPLELGAGVSESKDPNRSWRESPPDGDLALVTEDKRPADAPAMACGTEGCFIVWHGDPAGAFYAFIDPNDGKVQWRKQFSEKGGRPSLAVNGGRVAVAYYEPTKEGGRIRMSFLSRDGVSPPSTIARVYDTLAPRPSLAAGAKPDEWTIAWQDSDAPKGTPEVYASRIQCGMKPAPAP